MSAWQDFIATQTLSTAPIGDCAITDLSDFGLIRVTGEDRLSFLQGQLTNDVNQLGNDHSQLSSYCSPKGRMMSSFRIIPAGDNSEALLLMLPRDRLEATLKRLRMFVLMSKVTLDDVSDQLHALELSGACAAHLLPLEPPSTDNQCLSADGFEVVRLPGDRPRYLVIGDAAHLEALWTEAVPTATPTAISSWNLLDIRAGIPTVYEATTEAFVPQMANLELVDGVSFTKGCYTGQEVVARMQYLGKLKRRMFRVKIETDTQPAVGTELFSASSDSGQGAGKLVAAAPAPEGGYEALVVTQISSAEANDLHLQDAQGPALSLLSLPYSFPAPKE